MYINGTRNNMDEVNNEIESKKSRRDKIISMLIEFGKSVALFGLCAMIGMWLAIGTRAGSSLRFAQRYFKYYASSNYEAMYDMVKCKEDDFINEDYFSYKYESEKLYGGVKKYEFDDGVRKGNKVTYTVSYTTGNNKKGNFEIVVEKQKDKVYGIFNTWKVNLDDIIVKDCSIAVPSAVTGYVDHISMSGIKSSKTEDGSVTYYFIDRMFKGDHTVTLNENNITTYTFSEDFDSSGTQMVIGTDKLKLPEEDKNEMCDYAKFMLSSMYGYAMDGVTQYADIAYMFDSNADTQAKAQTAFDNLRASTVKEDGGLLKSINISNVSVAISSYTYPSDALIDVAYTYSYVAQTGRTSISGITKEYDGMGTAMAMLRFKRVDGVWKVTDISMPCADYTYNELKK